MKRIDPRSPAEGRFYSHGDHHYTAAEMHNEDVAHEHSDINVSAIAWSAAMVAVVCIGTAVLIVVLFGWFESQAKGRDAGLSPLVRPSTEMPLRTNAAPEFGAAPEPRLLTDEPTYLRHQSDQWQQQLRGYGWVDQTAGVTRIPIDEAKKLIVERGLPVRPDPVTDPRFGTHVPASGDSTSGRTITKTPAAPAPSAPAHSPAGHAPAPPPAHK
jgi:hypothetical protein